MAQFPAEVQQVLAKIRAAIIEEAPEAEDKISYGMPGYFQNGGVIWFGAYKRHIGFYPLTEAMLAHIEGLSAFKGAKSSIHFSLSQPMPYDLIRAIVRVRLAEISAQQQS